MHSFIRGMTGRKQIFVYKLYTVGCNVLVMQILLSGKTPKHIVMLLPLQGATAPTRGTQGAATLALGYGLHWAFSPPLQVQNDFLSIRNGEAMPKLQYKTSLLIAMW